MLLEQVRTVAAVLGDKEIAAEMMCEVKAYAEARARVGKPCGSTKAVANSTTTLVAANQVNREPTAAERAARYTGNDPSFAVAWASPLLSNLFCPA